jgi:hypothetical protein
VISSLEGGLTVSRRFLPHVHVQRGRQLAALIACVASILLVLPPGQASAQTHSPRGNPKAFAVYTMPEAPQALGRWDPCTPIGYRVNATLATPGAVDDVKEAVHRVSQATGLTFVYRGTTSIVPQSAWADDAYPADTQLVIAWVRPSQSTLWPTGSLSIDGTDTVAGRGGAWHVHATDPAGRLWGRYNRGFVLLNAGQKLPAGFRTTGPSGSRGLELMHEMGHVVGLDHPRQGGRQQVMYPVLTHRPARWGRGDLAGLKIVGAGGGCLVDV